MNGRFVGHLMIISGPGGRRVVKLPAVVQG
jgi:hypothetical protein